MKSSATFNWWPGVVSDEASTTTSQTGRRLPSSPAEGPLLWRSQRWCWRTSPSKPHLWWNIPATGVTWQAAGSARVTWQFSDPHDSPAPNPLNLIFSPFLKPVTTRPLIPHSLLYILGRGLKGPSSPAPEYGNQNEKVSGCKVWRSLSHWRWLIVCYLKLGGSRKTLVFWLMRARLSYLQNTES